MALQLLAWLGALAAAETAGKAIAPAGSKVQSSVDENDRGRIVFYHENGEGDALPDFGSIYVKLEEID